MRPRTATIQVHQSEHTGLWHVEIGRHGDAAPTVSESGKNLDKLLIYAIIVWKFKEGLGV